jgi:hypothetical protein
MVLAGHFVRVPALVKVELVEEKHVGRDLEAVRMWREEASKSYVPTSELIGS